MGAWVGRHADTHHALTRARTRHSWLPDEFTLRLTRPSESNRAAGCLPGPSDGGRYRGRQTRAGFFTDLPEVCRCLLTFLGVNKAMVRTVACVPFSIRTTGSLLLPTPEPA